MKRGILTVVWMLVALLAGGVVQADQRRLVLGITEFAIPEERFEIMDALDQALAPLKGRYDLQTRVYAVPELERAARNGELDLVLGSAGLVRRLSDVGARTVVSSVGPGAVDANRNEASTFLVRRERDDLLQLSDLRDKSMAANRPSGFSGYLIALGEIAMAGYDPDTFFSHRVFIGEQSASKKIAAAVLNGTADVGILKLCAWERLTAEDPSLRDRLRVLAPVASKSACMHSTQLYPAHTLAALPRVSPTALTDITIAFLQMTPTTSGRSWAVATDFLSVDRLYKSLKMGPYAYLRENVLKRIAMEYQGPILTILFAACMVLLQLLHTRRLLEKRTHQVRELAQKQAEQEKQLLFLERNTTVSQLSSMIAHELHQPLAAIRLYAKGLSRLVARTGGGTDVLDAAESIADEATRAKEIVERVRSYAKNRRPPHEYASLSTLLANAVSHFQASVLANDTRHMNVVIADDCDCVVKVAALEMELVFANLLKNARDALATTVRIRIEPSEAERTVLVRFEDDGPEADQTTLERLSGAASSEKPEGLGLGLGIARRIVEQHAGTIGFAVNAPNKGLTVSVVLPLPRTRPEALSRSA